MTLAEKILTEQQRLLRLEYEDERKAFTELTDRLGLQRIESSGNAWTGLRIGRSFYNSLNQRVVEVWRAEELADEEHEFEYGRSVTFFTEEPLTGGIKRRFGGTVNLVDVNRMLIVVPDNADLASLADGGRPGVMLSFDETTYKAMFEALARTLRADGRLGQLRDSIYSSTPMPQLSFDSKTFPYLNASQNEAVNNVLRAKDVAVVHGPPGTGKTTTLVEAIHETLMRETQVLVCAQSNMAVDWIAQRLTDYGINVLRIGNPSRVNDAMLASTYERRFEAHPDYPLLWKIRQNIRQILASGKKSTDQWHQKLDRLRSRAVELELRIRTQLFAEARVVACTLVGSASRTLEGMRFSTLFIDEAAQALEAASLIPLRRAGRVILAGDHCQLPPTVKSYEAMKAGLGKSLMERIVELHPECVTLLQEQYRMRTEIMAFPNRWFYHGHMKASPSVGWRSILDYDTAIEWIDTGEIGHTADDSDTSGDDDFREAVAGRAGVGRVNPREADLTLEAVEAYITRIGTRRMIDEKIDIGIISPYRAQVQYLRRRIRKLPFFKPVRHLIAINTVDGFQGQERDVIVVSMVRSNSEGQIGFLADLRRMNVAITRARMKLIIIGSAETLSHHKFYKQLYHYVTEEQH